MINILDYLSSLSAADSRSGQGRTLKASIQTTGYTDIVNGLGGSTLRFEKDEVIGILQETGTAKVTFPNKAGFQNVAYTKVQLNTPFFEINGSYVGYVWVESSKIVFTDVSEKPLIPVNNSVALSPVYSDALKGITLRENANTISKEITTVAYGDIVGYTNGTEKKYLAYTFWQIFDQKGHPIGWCAKGKGFSTLTKVQPKYLPKYLPDGTTNQPSANITYEQDPQSTVEITVDIGKIVLWTFGILLVLWVGIKVLSKKSKKGK